MGDEGLGGCVEDVDFCGEEVDEEGEDGEVEFVFGVGVDELRCVVDVVGYCVIDCYFESCDVDDDEGGFCGDGYDVDVLGEVFVVVMEEVEDCDNYGGDELGIGYEGVNGGGIYYERYGGDEESDCESERLEGVVGND